MSTIRRVRPEAKRRDPLGRPLICHGQVAYTQLRPIYLASHDRMKASPKGTDSDSDDTLVEAAVFVLDCVIAIELEVIDLLFAELWAD
jgi:hypothetical protein